MASFEIVLWIFNLSLRLAVTPLDAKFRRFKVEAISGGSSATVLNYSPDNSWVAERASMKCFTKEYILQLGKLIEIERPEFF